jgi:hypothetical protein
LFSAIRGPHADDVPVEEQPDDHHLLDRRHTASAASRSGQRRKATSRRPPRVALATTSGFDVHAWNGTTSAAEPTGGKANLALTGSPVLLVER